MGHCQAAVLGEGCRDRVELQGPDKRPPSRVLGRRVLARQAARPSGESRLALCGRTLGEVGVEAGVVGCPERFVVAVQLQR